MRRTLEPTEALRLLDGGPVVLVTTRWRDQTDVMPAIWTTPLSRKPPLVGVVVQPSRHTHEMIRFAEQFALNFPGRDLMNHTHYFGAVSGRDVNKLDLSKLATFKAEKVDAPLIDGCVGYVECGLEDALRFGDHTLFVGRVVAASMDDEAFEETWLLADDDYKPLHYLGLNRYAILAETMEARIPKPEEETGEELEEEATEQLEQGREQREKRREGE